MAAALTDMPFVSVTRLRLRSLRFVLPFVWQSRRSARQAARSEGCLDVKLRKTRGLAFWTLTSWADETSMKAFRDAPPHREAMRKLRHWCDEAAVGHWIHERDNRPGWEEAAAHLAEHGRLSRVSHPSQAQQAGRINTD